MKKILLLTLIGAVTYASDAQIVIRKKTTTVSTPKPVIVTTTPKKIVVVDDPAVVNTPAVTNPRRLPPGQAKKLYGAQSARDFAPGHQRKNRGWKNRDNDDRVEFATGNNKHHGKGKGHKGHKNDD